MLFPSCQTVKIKWLDEVALAFAFLLSTIVSKNELVERWASSPVSFQGWQLAFTCVIFILLLIHPRIKNEVQALNRTTLALTLPVCVIYTIAIAAAAPALSALPVSIFLAWTNFSPALLTFITRKGKSFRSATALGSITVLLSIIIITVIDSNETNKMFYLYLLVHVLFNFIQSLYLKKINMQVTDFTIIFYNNVVSFIALFPVSVYNITETNLTPSNLLPCFVAGFFSLANQIFGSQVKSKNTKFLTILGLAQFLTIFVSFYFFEDTLDLWVWCLVGTNCFISGFVLNVNDENIKKNNQFILVVPHVSKNIYVEKYINYNDMA